MIVWIVSIAFYDSTEVNSMGLTGAYYKNKYRYFYVLFKQKIYRYNSYTYHINCYYIFNKIYLKILK